MCFFAYIALKQFPIHRLLSQHLLAFSGKLWSEMTPLKLQITSACFSTKLWDYSYLSCKGVSSNKTSKCYINNCDNCTTSELKTGVYKVLRYIKEYCIISHRRFGHMSRLEVKKTGLVPPAWHRTHSRFCHKSDTSYRRNSAWWSDHSILQLLTSHSSAFTRPSH